MQVIVSLLSAAFALLGRWIQLNPDRIIPAGQFTSGDTLGGRLFRAQLAVLGTIAVSGGTYLALHGFLQFATFGSVALDWITTLIAIASAIVAAVRVRSEASARATYKSKSPNG